MGEGVTDGMIHGWRVIESSVQVFDLRLQRRGFYTGYNVTVNPMAANAFGAAAFRFGHSLIPSKLDRCNRYHELLPYRNSDTSLSLSNLRLFDWSSHFFKKLHSTDWIYHLTKSLPPPRLNLVPSSLTELCEDLQDGIVSHCVVI